MIEGIFALDAEDTLDILSRLQEAFTEDSVTLLWERLERRLNENKDIFEYPPQSNAPMADLWTDKQRRYFFWALSQGLIQVPYERTFDLQNSIEYEVVGDGYEALIAASVENSSEAGSYARWVIGEEQSIYFEQRTDWKQLPVMLEEKAGDFEAFMTDDFERLLDAFVFDRRVARFRDLGTSRFASARGIFA